MISRFVLAAFLSVLVVITGSSTYLYLERHKSKVAEPPKKPTAVAPKPQALILPGTLYLAQSGAIYSLSSGRFHQLTPEDGWSQPSATPDGNSLLAVKNFNYYNDVYQLNRYGAVMRQVTNNRGRYGMGDPSLNHWSFYPRLSSDGQTLWMSYDGSKDYCDHCYVIMFDIWAMPFNGNIRQARLWTYSNDGTGGDIQPIPVSGGVLYTKYSYTDDGKITGQLWFTNRQNAYGKALTEQWEDCRSPSFSPDASQVVMICTYLKQESYLVIAQWSGSSLGPRKIVITDQLVAQPTWAPDGSGIAYLAPSAPNGPFQLWWLAKEAYVPPPPPPPPTPTPGGPHNGPLPSPTLPPPPPPVRPVQVTTNNGFDATSPMAWLN